MAINSTQTNKHKPLFNALEKLRLVFVTYATEPHTTFGYNYHIIYLMYFDCFTLDIFGIHKTDLKFYFRKESSSQNK